MPTSLCAEVVRIKNTYEFMHVKTKIYLCEKKSVINIDQLINHDLNVLTAARTQVIINSEGSLLERVSWRYTATPTRYMFITLRAICVKILPSHLYSCKDNKGADG